MRPAFSILVSLCCGLGLSACSSLASINESAPAAREGLVYYLPKRDIKIDVTVASKVLQSVTIGSSAAYADHDAGRYLLRYNPNAFGKHKLDIEVSAGGLLKSASATAEDRIAGLGGFGKLAGYVKGFSASLESTSTPEGAKVGAACAVDGTHVFLIEAGAKEQKESLCGGSLEVVVKPLFDQEKALKGPVLREGEEHSGVFYRMGKPYRVTVSGVISAAAIVHSPSMSEEFFLPVARTLFATNDAKITIADGEATPGKYAQETDGEVASFLKIPAAIVGPYFEAIGGVFTGFSKKATDEAKARSDLVMLELAKQKQAACYTAIKDKDTAALEALECGK